MKYIILILIILVSLNADEDCKKYIISDLEGDRSSRTNALEMLAGVFFDIEGISCENFDFALPYLIKILYLDEPENHTLVFEAIRYSQNDKVLWKKTFLDAVKHESFDDKIKSSIINNLRFTCNDVEFVVEELLLLVDFELDIHTRWSIFLSLDYILKRYLPSLELRKSIAEKMYEKIVNKDYKVFLHNEFEKIFGDELQSKEIEYIMVDSLVRTKQIEFYLDKFLRRSEEDKEFLHYSFILLINSEKNSNFKLEYSKKIFLVADDNFIIESLQLLRRIYSAHGKIMLELYPLLENVLENSNKNVQLEALQSLALYDSLPQIVDLLRKYYKNDDLKEEILGIIAVWEFPRKFASELDSLMIDGLNSNNQKVRRYALISLQKIEKPRKDIIQEIEKFVQKYNSYQDLKSVNIVLNKLEKKTEESELKNYIRKFREKILEEIDKKQ